MFFFWCRFFPVLLVFCALALGALEMRYPFREGRSQRRRTLRLFGSGLLCVLGGMIWFGHLPAGAVTPDEAFRELRYWGLVFGLLLVLLLLAGLDSIEGARDLKRYLEGVEHEEVERIRQHLSAVDGKPGR